jgi:putative toxin-antitoxin system antitoxin component (TIGR02293 family)
MGGKSVLAVAKQIETGFSYSLMQRFREASGLPDSSIAAVVRVPQQTLRRRAGRLSPDESERLLRISTLFEKSVELFDGDTAAARQWLTAPKKALAGETPLEFARTEVGAREVENLIGRLEHGVFS